MTQVPRRSWGLPGLLLSLLTVSAYSASAQNPMKSVNSPEGGRIMYGVVDGATSQASGLASVLRAVHTNCGERPWIGRVFEFRGTETVGVFFNVVNHPAGNVKIAGLAVAALNGSGQVEAALVSDDASRFGTTVNPMLKELFGAWHARSAAATASASTGKSAAPGASSSAAGGHSAPAARLHTVSASDNSASIGIPDGWTLDPHSAGGSMLLSGPQGELIGLSMTRTAIDPTNPQQMRLPRIPGMIAYPFRGDLMKEFPALFQAWRRANGRPPAPLQVDEIKPMPAPQGDHCVVANGHMDPDGKGMQTFSDYMCAFDPGTYGMYIVTLSHMLVSNALAKQEDNTVKAILASWKVNQQVINQQTAAASQQAAANTQALIRRNEQWVDHIHQIGADATARMNAAQKAHDIQNQSFEQREDAISRNGQGFSNYLLDQTVVQDNNMYNNGTIGHGTAWNSTADALVKADPNRFEIVDTPNYWRGIDY
jgi:hypothetical protein